MLCRLRWFLEVFIVFRFSKKGEKSYAGSQVKQRAKAALPGLRRRQGMSCLYCELRYGYLSVADTTMIFCRNTMDGS